MRHPWRKYGHPVEVLKFGRVDKVLVNALVCAAQMRVRATQMQIEANYLIDATNLMLQAAGGFDPLYYFKDPDTGAAVCEPSGMEPEYHPEDKEIDG